MVKSVVELRFFEKLSRKIRSHCLKIAHRNSFSEFCGLSSFGRNLRFQELPLRFLVFFLDLRHEVRFGRTVQQSGSFLALELRDYHNFHQDFWVNFWTLGMAMVSGHCFFELDSFLKTKLFPGSEH